MIETRKKRLELEMLERTAALEKEALAAAAECDVDLAQIADEEDEFLRSSSQDDVRSTGSKVRNWISKWPSLGERRVTAFASILPNSDRKEGEYKPP